MTLVMGLLCWAFAIANVAFVVFGNPALAPLSIVAALAAFCAGAYSIYVWMET